MGNDFKNPFTLLDSGLRMGIGLASDYAYAMFGNLPGSSWLYPSSADQILQGNGYMQNKTQFRDDELARRIRVLEKRVSELGYSPAIIRENAYWIKMLMRQDTPEIRNMIREKCGPIGGLLLWLWDMATGTEAGYEDVYSSTADTYGTLEGNAGSLYQSNYVMNKIRGQEVDASGKRQMDAGVYSAWMQYKQSTNYSFEQSVGVGLTDIPDYNAVFTEEFGKDTYEDTRLLARTAYLRNRMYTTDDKEERRVLAKLVSLSEKGAWNDKAISKELDSVIGEGKRFADVKAVYDTYDVDTNSAQFAVQKTADLVSEAISKDLQEKKGYYEAFQEYAGSRLTLKENATDQEKKQYEKDLQKLKEQFISEATDDFFKTQQTISAGDNSATNEVRQLLNNVEEAYGTAGQIIRDKGDENWTEAHYAQAVGQAIWMRMSQEERQGYLDRAPGHEEGAAMTLAGIDEMNKYAAASMRKFDYKTAAVETLQLHAAARRSNMSNASLSRIGTFIGDNLQNKNLTGDVTRAFANWRAAARSQVGQVNDIEEMEAAQRLSRSEESSEGRILAMFLNQKIDPNSELGQLQEAIKTQKLSKEQFNSLKERLNNPGTFIDEIAKATHRDPADLQAETQYLDPLLHGLAPEVRAALPSLTAQLAMRAYADDLVTEETVSYAASRLGDERLKSVGLSIKSSDVLANAVRSGVDPYKLAAGKIDEPTLLKLEKEGYRDVAKYGRERASARKNAKDKEAFDRESEGTTWTLLSDVMGDSKAAWNLRLTSIDAMQTIENSKEDADADLAGSGVPAAPHQQTPTQALGQHLGKQIPKNNPIKDTALGIYDAISGMAGSFMGSMAKTMFGFGSGGGGGGSNEADGKSMAQSFGKGFLDLLGDPDFQDKTSDRIASIIALSHNKAQG